MTSEVEAAVRRELGKQGRRWAPVAAVLLLVVAVLATSRDDTVETATDLGPGSANAAIDGGFGATDPDASNGNTGATLPTDAGPGGAQPGGAGNEPAATTPSAGPGGGGPATAGVSRTGVTCNGSNRQLPESSYGPLCVPEFTGDNGGATYPGVSADEIVVTYRIGSSASSGALQALGGDELESVGFDQDGMGRDMAVLVDHFNTRFELYGRTVRFVPYNGQGDILEEYQGRGRQGAQTDAARAKDLGAFADVSYAGQTQPYTESLAANGIVAFSPIYLSREFHQRNAPYTHSAMWPAGEDGAHFQANVVCGAMTPGKAVRSGDPLMRTRDRKIGIIHAENPEYSKMGVILEQRLKACGAPFARRVAYALDVTRAAQTAANAMAQMQAAQATTILCVCDFLVPRVLMEAADGQGFVPEWFLTFHWTDTFYRTYPERQFRGGLVGGGVTEPVLETEPGEVFRAAGGGTPESPFTFDKVYQQIHLLFTGLQAAGPNLTPESMFRGLERVPTARSGAIGPLEFGPGPAMPRRWFPLGAYDPDASSNLDGRPGSSIGCRGGRYFRFDDQAAFADSLGCPL